MAYINGKEILFSPIIALDENHAELSAIKKAVAMMGGTISYDATPKEIPSAIETIPIEDSKYTLAEDTATAYRKAILGGATKYASIDKIGGMTYADGNTLKHAKVTALVSKGANLFDIDKFLSLKDNAEYYSKNESNELIVIKYDTRANEAVESIMTLSAGTYYVQFDRETVGTAPYEVFITGTNTGLVSSSNPYYFTLTEEKQISMKFVKQTTANFGNVQVHRGTGKQEFHPFVGTIDTFTIPEAVQALEGYGLGIDSSYHNTIEYRNGRVIFVQWVKQCIISGVAAPYNTYDNIQYYAFDKPDDFIGMDSTSDAFMIGGFGKLNHSNWDSTDFVGVATGRASWDDMWVGFAKGTTLEDAKAALEGKPMIYALAEPIFTDITDLMSADNFIEIEENGSIIFENEHENAVPSTITYVREVGK